MNSFTMTTQGFNEFKRAIERNPQLVAARGRTFLNRGIMAYRRVIEGAPWRVGQRGGGVPVDTGNLKKSHRYRVTGLRGVIDFDENPNPSQSRYPYGAIVHGDRPKPFKMRGKNLQTRPWLNYAVKKADSTVEVEYRKFLKQIVSELAS